MEEDFLTLGAIGEDEESLERKWKNKEVERMRESEGERKREEMEVFVKREKKELWRIWRDRRMKKKKKLLVIVGKNEKGRNTLDG